MSFGQCRDCSEWLEFDEYNICSITGGRCKKCAKNLYEKLQTENERLREIMKNATLDYGYANGWGNWEPVLVKECKEKGHNPNDRSTEAFGHDNIVWCDICRYSYKYDSS